MTQPFGDVPLFRELHRLMSAGSGPVNFEIARQVARALVGEVASPQRAGELEAAFRAGARDSELVLGSYSRLMVVEPIQVADVTPARWVEESLEAWRWLFERLATRFTAELGSVAGDDDAGPLQAALGQLSPLVIGIQVGTLMGHLGRDVLGRYDLPIPRDDHGKLLFVAANAGRIAAEYGVDASLLARWLALRDAARHVVATAVPWFVRYHRSLISEIVDSIEIDRADLERRLMDLQSKGMEALGEGLDASDMIPLARTPRHERALARLRAFLAVVEGYAGHAAAAVAPRLVGDAARIEEAVTRHRATPSSGQAMLTGFLGITLDRALEAAGQSFCNAVVELRDVATLALVWDAPDNLPSPEEIRDPFAWMERVADDGSSPPPG